MRCALFVDLPNFYSSLLRSKIDNPRVLRDYFLYHCDFDRLALHLTGEATAVWVFYSDRRFGPSSERIKDKRLSEYIDMINRLRGVTAQSVDIPGEQREPVFYQCEKCGYEGTGQSESEKGIDTSLTVHLFDTMDSWDVAYLLSGDADFVPCVASLRRRGKLVTGVGFQNASSALVRECYDYIDLGQEFIEEDVATYNLFKKDDGVISCWLNSLVTTRTDVSVEDGAEVVFNFSWDYVSSRENLNPLLARENKYVVDLDLQGDPDLSTRTKKNEAFCQAFRDCFLDTPRILNSGLRVTIRPHIWSGVERRLADSFSLPRLGRLNKGGWGCSTKHKYKIEEDRYVIVEE